MILPHEALNVSVHGAQKTTTFKMKASAKAFSIMMDQLYSNKIAAVIREICSNAFDAHVSAGTAEKPFHIKIPNDIDPTFRVRDYGVGLSPDDIEHIYTTFFESTKEDSNDFIGALGLGSKSPFSVSDSFNVTSYFDGMKSVYIAYLNEDRIPSLSTFSSVPTDEENGLEIEVAIKKDETRYFRDEVNNQLKYFKVKPTISGDSQFQWELEEDYVYQGTNWKMVGAGRYDSIRAIQGQVAYPIQTHNMGARAEDASPALRALLETNLLLTFDIGEININPSRESLSYDDPTVDHIMAKAQVVLDELPAQIAERLEAAETEWEARLLYNSICASLGGSGTILLNKIEESGEITWRGKSVASLSIRLSNDLIRNYSSFHKSLNKFKKENHSVTGTRDENDEYVYHWGFKVAADKLIVYTDANDKAANARAKQYAADNHIRNIHIIEVEGTVDRFDELRAEMGHPEIIRASTLEKIRRVSSTGTKDTKIHVQRYTSGWTKTQRWESTTSVDDMDELSGVYVDLDRVNVMHKGTMIDNFSDYISFCNGLGIMDDIEVYGLRTKNQKREHELENFFDYIERRMKSLGIKLYKFNTKPFDDQINDDSYLRNKILSDMPKSSDLYKITNAINSNIQNKISSKNIVMLKKVGIELAGKDMTALTEKCKAKYPMIKGSRYRVTDEQIIEYSIQMDKLEKLEAAK